MTVLHRVCIKVNFFGQLPCDKESETKSETKSKTKQECIPVECGTPTCWPSVFWCILPWVAYNQMDAPLGCSPDGCNPPPLVHRMTDSRFCKHYLSTTSFAGGKNTCLVQWVGRMLCFWSKNTIWKVKVTIPFNSTPPKETCKIHE